MSGLNDEMSLAEKLCGELLTAADLRQLCVARGFPIAGTAKDDLARSAAVRLLDPRGVREAMTKLDPLWLKVLHLIAASRKPLSLDPIAKLVEPNVNVWKLDYRALWRKVVAGLLIYGVALVHESAAANHSKSRFARFELVLPTEFRSALPPFPIQAEAISSAPTRGTLDELLEAALRSFIEQTSSVGKAKPDTLVQRVAAELELKSGIFKLRNIQHPTRELLTAAVRDIWLKGLPTRSKYPAGMIASVAHHILGSLPEGTGCVASTLAAQLAEFGFQTKSEEVAAFVDEGIMAGFLLRYDRRKTEPLVRAADDGPLLVRTALELKPSSSESCVADPSTAFLPLMELGTFAFASLKNGELSFESDPIRLGRAWRELPTELVAKLRAASKSFDQAARTIEKREGQIVAHRGLSVLRVEDTGLRALLCHRFASEVRALDHQYLACLSGKLEEVVAFSKKEGFVARRTS